MTEPVPSTIPPTPKVMLVVLVAAAICFVYGLGMAVGGHEWQNSGSFQPGVGLVVFAVAVALVTGSLHMAYCYGWNQRGAQVRQAADGRQRTAVTPNGALIAVAA